MVLRGLEKNFLNIERPREGDYLILQYEGSFLKDSPELFRLFRVGDGKRVDERFLDRRNSLRYFLFGKVSHTPLKDFFPDKYKKNFSKRKYLFTMDEILRIDARMRNSLIWNIHNYQDFIAQDIAIDENKYSPLSSEVLRRFHAERIWVKDYNEIV